MNRTLLFGAALFAISSGAFAQGMRPGANTATSAYGFGGMRQPAAALNTVNRGPSVATWSFGASPYSMTPATRAMGSSQTPAAGWSFGGATHAMSSVAPRAESSATPGADARPGPVSMTFPVASWNSPLMDLQAGVTNATSTNKSYAIRQEAAPNLSDLPAYVAPYPSTAIPTVVSDPPISITPYSGMPISIQPIR
jgi:hypothetical protein